MADVAGVHETQSGPSEKGNVGGKVGSERAMGNGQSIKGNGLHMFSFTDTPTIYFVVTMTMT